MRESLWPRPQSKFARGRGGDCVDLSTSMMDAGEACGSSEEQGFYLMIKENIYFFNILK